MPQLISLKGISEAMWERKRPVWEGDCERDRLPRKRAKTKHDPNDLESIDGTENGNRAGEEDADGPRGSSGTGGRAGSNAPNGNVTVDLTG